MLETKTPSCLWDFCIVYHSLIRRFTSLNIRDLQGEVPETALTGDTSDISFICEFGWYDWVWYETPKEDERRRLGRYVGPSFDVGDALCACDIYIDMVHL